LSIEFDKNAWATFWAIFPQTRLVALLPFGLRLKPKKLLGHLIWLSIDFLSSSAAAAAAVDDDDWRHCRADIFANHYEAIISLEAAQRGSRRLPPPLAGNDLQVFLAGDRQEQGVRIGRIFAY
jgi:hypothetical protein